MEYSENLIALLPIRPHIKSFIIHRDRLDPEEPKIDLNGNTVFTTIASAVLLNKSAYLEKPYENNLKKYTETIPISLNTEAISRNRIYINRFSILLFDQLCSSILGEIVAERVQLYIQQGKEAKEAIYSIMHQYDLLEKISYDALIKAEYRLRKYRAIDKHYRYEKLKNKR